MQFDWLSDLTPALTAQELWHQGRYQDEGLFHVVYHPRHPFAISCGAGLLAEHIRRFRFSPDIITRMGQMTAGKGHSIFSESFLNHLQRLRLRVDVWAAPEGMLLLPGEPLLIARGPIEQIHLLESAFRFLIWRSSQWATRIAVARWETHNWKEEDTPLAPSTTTDFDGWKIRAEYIGGALADDILDTIKEPSRPPADDEGLVQIWGQKEGAINHEIPLTQIRRVYKGQEALGDIWLTEEQEELASVSKTSARMTDTRTGKVTVLKFSRFQNLYQPVLVKGHPVLPNTRISYLRQRTLKQLEAFHHSKLDDYHRGFVV
jgi:Nicotinate phosphoribosyltransferase (NAPRTase) N-terminal domain